MRRVLVTGSSGHLGEALVRTLAGRGIAVTGFDVRPSRWTDAVASVTDRDAVRDAIRGSDTVLHTASLHKPQLSTVTRQAFVDVNVHGTLTLLEAAVDAGVDSFVMTSSTTVFGDALIPAAGQPAAWIDETVIPVPKNVYGVTKAAAEDVCQITHRNQGLPCIVLRTSRFFPEADDSPGSHGGRSDDNVKADEYAYRRVALDDAVQAHLAAAQRAPTIGFARYLISATTPFARADAAELRRDAGSVLARRAPAVEHVWRDLGWRFPGTIDRVYDNTRARTELGWAPRFDIEQIAELLTVTGSIRTPVASAVGSKAYLDSSYHLGAFGPS